MNACPSERGYLPRVDPALLDALSRWAADDLRSLNRQIAFLLRRALRASGRVPSVEVDPRGRGQKNATELR